MQNRWFNNYFQILQLFVACVACLLTAVNAWPAISSFQFLNIAPLIFYVVVGLIALSIALYPRKNIAPENPLTNTPSSANHLTYFQRTFANLDASFMKAECAVMHASMIKGDRWIAGSAAQKVQIIYHDLVQEGEVWRADIEFRTGGKLFGGGRTRRLDDNRFLIPADDTHSGLSGAFAVTFHQHLISADMLRIEHINSHSGEISLLVCRVWGNNEK